MDIQIVITVLVVAILGSYVSKPYCDKLFLFALRGGRNPRIASIICYSLGSAISVIFIIIPTYVSMLFYQDPISDLDSFGLVIVTCVLAVFYHVFLAWFARLNTVEKLKEFGNRNT